MKLIRLGQTLCDGKAAPPPPPTANALLFLKKNTNMYGGFHTEGCAVVDPPRSSNASTMYYGQPITKWEDYNGSSVYAEQTTCLDCPQYNYGSAETAVGETRFFDLNSSVVLTGEFTIYIKAILGATNNNSFVGGNSTNFWRISNNKEFRVRIGGTANNLFTEATDTIGINNKGYIFCLQRDASGYLSLFVNGREYNDKPWGSTTNQDIDTMTIGNIGAQADDTQTFAGNLNDVLIYDTEHDASQRAIIYNYL